jgi:hypothetical protein
MICPLANHRSEERGMHKILVIVTLILIATCGICYGEEEKPELIKVIPAYMEADNVNQGAPGNREDPFYAPPPRPRDQMYVFWILGKALSYPVDKVEQFVAGKIRQVSMKPEVKPSAAAVNPFEAIDLKEIPPAPPVTD